MWPDPRLEERIEGLEEDVKNLSARLNALEDITQSPRVRADELGAVKVALTNAIAGLTNVAPELRIRVLASLVVFFGVEAAVATAVDNAIEQQERMVARRRPKVT